VYSSKVQLLAVCVVVGRRLRAAEAVAQAPQRLMRRLRRDDGVDLHCQRELRVSQDLHRDPRMDVEIGEETAAATPTVVHGDCRDAGPLAPVRPRAVEVAGSMGMPRRVVNT
jgi:hypothetical protein